MSCWILGRRILKITLLTSEISAIVQKFEFWGGGRGVAFLLDLNENWPFPILWPLLSFQVCWHTECSTLTASSFRIWNSLAGITSPPLYLFTMMIHKGHLTSHSRMSASRWVVITPLLLSGSLIYFSYSSSVYSYHLFLVSSASVGSIPFLSCIVSIFARNIPFVFLIFLKKFLVFLILSFGSISLPWSLNKAFLSFLDILQILHSDWYVFFFFFSHLPFTFLSYL